MTGRTTSVHIGLQEGPDATVVTLTGALDVRSYPEVRDTLLKCAAEQPHVLVVVIDDLVPVAGSLLSIFAQVWMRVSDWPGIPFVLVSAGLPEGAIARFVPVYPTVAAALRGAELPPKRRRARLALPRAEGTARQSRDFTRDVCQDWHLPSEVVSDARSVANELVENVLAHTESEAVLRLELRPKVLSVAVADDSPVPARLREGQSGYYGGLGLLLVAQLTKVWGCTPSMAGGKVVWGVLARGTPRGSG
ncbi:ATP-binding protein [Amycolatopsis magusensis]|uniref:ATP-binding protein n=1 Tax=Amycolatopsis magusensis TaxID=882444 RepID=UPI0024A91EBA|nr:ATP-binding protein [Amycolatopsis magusensis]MDI5979308.1 ATP-binding protein [Amycolatopsis magusensis]